MFRLFKTKEKKQEDKQKYLEKELKEFTEKYKAYFNCYAFNGKDIIIYKEPQILNDELVINLIRVDTPEGCVNNGYISFLNFQYGEDFLIKHRTNFLKIKHQMELLGLSVTKDKNYV